MKDIIQIKFRNEYYNTEVNRKYILDIYNVIFEKSVELKIWDESIKAIIVTDEFENEIANQALKWNVKSIISKEKEQIVASKILFNQDLNNPEYFIFFHYQCFQNISIHHIQIIFSQILSIYFNKIFPINVLEHRHKKILKTLEDYVKFYSVDWCKAIYTKNFLNKFFNSPIPPTDNNFFLNSFKRKLKKNLFDYKSDLFNEQILLDNFWVNYFGDFKTLILRILENDTTDEKLKINDNELIKGIIYEIILQVGELANTCLDNLEYDVKSIIESVKKFSLLFDVNLEEDSDYNLWINIIKNPKDYFIDELVETEPRIVCYLDILGFSQLIETYDNDITSTILQDIQESFSYAINLVLKNKDFHNKEILKHLKYQSFSDNICISIPYFDNEIDFISNFNLIGTYVKSLQFILMTKGVFLRGGISTGSFYSDNNIIFSKGLVNAYNLESKRALYPRVIIDNSIISKLQSYKKFQENYLGICNSIIFDWENIFFLNPFGFADTSIQQFTYFKNKIDLFTDDDPLTILLNSRIKSIFDMTINLMKNAKDNEIKEIEPIKNKIINNIIIHQKDENITSKYYWLLELIKWYENDPSGKLKFQCISEIINQPPIIEHP